MTKFFTIFLALGLVQSAFAEKNEEFAKADTVDLFAATAQSIRKDMEKGGRFEFITSAAKIEANHDLDSMTALLQKAGSVSAMTMQDKVTLFNTQEHLNGVLTHSDSERLVCKHESQAGSHIQTTKCQTYGDVQREKFNIKDTIDRNLHDNPQGALESCPGNGRIANKCTGGGGPSH